ncbi:uncharacterized protein EI97DRAFT_432112 [Westerdykella ornata]|uniref:Uncharacterized protein n=1 Tax=Westerdykella ornata TaxID=318751 RepID=A0A6A6JP53_WESOR|nr:uncharacterized protein EI97DRAFT_432112 [Westerdykella ornata]KAF2278025.1 hypothetical protein EI97DRAFT_432112 [Westerdykella ornata]
MRLTTILSPALLAATAFATDSSSSSSSSSSASSSTESASSASSSKVPDPTPIGEIWTPKWTATSSALDPYTTSCHSTTTLTAEIYQLKELYPTLKDFAPQLKVFYNKQHYPGTWNGEDKHGDKRELLKMDYEALPYGVREWINKNTNQRWFSVQDDVVFFAPGAIYPLVPLWVDEADGKKCEGVFDYLETYSTEPKDGAILGKVEHKKTGKNEVEITIEAFQVKEKAAENQRDEL